MPSSTSTSITLHRRPRRPDVTTPSPPKTTTTPTRESLAWFRQRRDEWMNAPRRRVQPLVLIVAEQHQPGKEEKDDATTSHEKRSSLLLDTKATVSKPASLALSSPPSSSFSPSSAFTPATSTTKTPANTSTATSISPSARDRLLAFYRKHNPQKLNSVEETLLKYAGREDELFAKLEAKYNNDPTKKMKKKADDDYLAAEGTGPICFLEVCLNRNGHQPTKRIEIQLFADKAPLACRNFRELCRTRAYQNCSIHRIVPNFCCQGGDYTKGDGTGGRSIYAPNTPGVSDLWGNFIDERPFLRHDVAGLLSMANNGPNRNNSQFFITLRPLPHLNGKHVVFGKVCHPEGLDFVLHELGTVPTDPKTQRPLEPVMIVDCGLVEDGDKGVSADDVASKHYDQVTTNKSSPLSPVIFAPSPFLATTSLRKGGETAPLGSAATAPSFTFGSSTTLTSPFHSLGSTATASEKGPIVSFGGQAASPTESAGDIVLTSTRTENESGANAIPASSFFLGGNSSKPETRSNLFGVTSGRSTDLKPTSTAAVSERSFGASEPDTTSKTQLSFPAFSFASSTNVQAPGSTFFTAPTFSFASMAATAPRNSPPSQEAGAWSINASQSSSLPGSTGNDNESEPVDSDYVDGEESDDESESDESYSDEKSSESSSASCISAESEQIDSSSHRMTVKDSLRQELGEPSGSGVTNLFASPSNGSRGVGQQSSSVFGTCGGAAPLSFGGLAQMANQSATTNKARAPAQETATGIFGVESSAFGTKKSFPAGSLADSSCRTDSSTTNTALGVEEGMSATTTSNSFSFGGMFKTGDISTTQSAKTASDADQSRSTSLYGSANNNFATASTSCLVDVAQSSAESISMPSVTATKNAVPSSTLFGSTRATVGTELLFSNLTACSPFSQSESSKKSSFAFSQKSVASESVHTDALLHAGSQATTYNATTVSAHQADTPKETVSLSQTCTTEVTVTGESEADAAPIGIQAPASLTESKLEWTGMPTSRPTQSPSGNRQEELGLSAISESAFIATSRLEEQASFPGSPDSAAKEVSTISTNSLFVSDKNSVSVASQEESTTSLTPRQNPTSPQTKADAVSTPSTVLHDLVAGDDGPISSKQQTTSEMQKLAADYLSKQNELSADQNAPAIFPKSPEKSSTSLSSPSTGISKIIDSRGDGGLEEISCSTKGGRAASVPPKNQPSTTSDSPLKQEIKASVLGDSAAESTGDAVSMKSQIQGTNSGISLSTYYEATGNKSFNKSVSSNTPVQVSATTSSQVLVAEAENFSSRESTPSHEIKPAYSGSKYQLSEQLVQNDTVANAGADAVADAGADTQEEQADKDTESIPSLEDFEEHDQILIKEHRESTSLFSKSASVNKDDNEAFVFGANAWSRNAFSFGSAPALGQPSFFGGLGQAPLGGIEKQSLTKALDEKFSSGFGQAGPHLSFKNADGNEKASFASGKSVSNTGPQDETTYLLTSTSNSKQSDSLPTASSSQDGSEKKFDKESRVHDQGERSAGLSVIVGHEGLSTDAAALGYSFGQTSCLSPQRSKVTSMSPDRHVSDTNSFQGISPQSPRRTSFDGAALNDSPFVFGGNSWSKNTFSFGTIAVSSPLFGFQGFATTASVGKKLKTSKREQQAPRFGATKTQASPLMPPFILRSSPESNTSANSPAGFPADCVILTGKAAEMRAPPEDQDSVSTNASRSSTPDGSLSGLSGTITRDASQNPDESYERSTSEERPEQSRRHSDDLTSMKAETNATAQNVRHEMGLGSAAAEPPVSSPSKRIPISGESPDAVHMGYAFGETACLSPEKHDAASISAQTPSPKSLFESKASPASNSKPFVFGANSWAQNSFSFGSIAATSAFGFQGFEKTSLLRSSAKKGKHLKKVQFGFVTTPNQGTPSFGFGSKSMSPVKKIVFGSSSIDHASGKNKSPDASFSEFRHTSDAESGSDSEGNKSEIESAEK